MDQFQYRDGHLYCEDLKLEDLASKVGTPAYIYSQATLLEHYDKLVQAFAALKPTICYSIKSCGNMHLCKLLASRGAGMDVVSGGELFRAQQAGADMAKIVYAGVGKSDDEIRYALQSRIGYFNIESEEEFENIARIARQMNLIGRGALRVNPDVADPKTHAKTTTGKKETKFGVDIERARRFFERYGRDSHLRLTALHLHIGSPIYSAEPYERAITKALALVQDLRSQGHDIEMLDIGGGFAADYETGKAPRWEDYASTIVPLLQPFVNAGGRIVLEPGRTLIANAGVLLTRVQYIKTGGSKKFIIVDSGMHHLVRPTMYDAFHFIWPAAVKPEHVPDQRSQQMGQAGLELCDVVGPICETGDFLAKDRLLPPVKRGDLICVYTAGAYGMVMASNYNAVPRPPEVLVHGKTATLIRRRETYDDLVGPERQAVAVM